MEGSHLRRLVRPRASNRSRLCGRSTSSNVATVAGRDWLAAPLDELVKHIVTTHEYLKLDLPVLGHRLEKVTAVHGARDSEVLPRKAEVFAILRAELEMHLRKEETILFPCIEQCGRAEVQRRLLPPVPFGSIANPIAMMEREHEGAGEALGEIRRLTHDFELPPYACSKVRALY